MYNLLRLFSILRIIASVASYTERKQIEGVPLILFHGTLLNDLGAAVEGADVQFWQTDPNGVYDHPAAKGASSLFSSFQYFGTTKTLGDGSFSFLTHRPGIYTGRPTHIHYKVWVDGENILTSQFYFADENTQYSDMQQLELQEYDFGADGAGFVTNKTIVVDLKLGGSGPFTPRDMEGPFYPVVDFFNFDNDLTNSAVTSDAILEGTSMLTPSSRPSVMTGLLSQPSALSDILPYSDMPSLLFYNDSNTETPTLIADQSPFENPHSLPATTTNRDSQPSMVPSVPPVLSNPSIAEMDSQASGGSAIFKMSPGVLGSLLLLFAI
ncbi:hypothetical protein HJC23_013311 [Cyclotella cryptica]|uniref:Intradiol ring-cleavage dioxygenases domain-containing protein n=1 Tax=Cyclotella cryptica TaxID=29204 RepID=A0ABD3PZZ8_9STRA|eukprot:CCRYP_009726-RA/>CCRYP_009726-RA protein AED:0.17 eAED:-0.14 QI:0/-1/0/1/-1/1/1/0/323